MEPVHRADPGRWGDLLDPNLASAAVFAAAVAPALVAAAPSCLVFIGSAAHQAFPNNAAYVASKHGLAGLAGGAFLELRDLGVKVSLVSPGLVRRGSRPAVAHGRQRAGTAARPADVSRRRLASW